MQTYLAAVAVIYVIGLTLLGLYAVKHGESLADLIALVIALAAIPMSELAVGGVNYFVTRLVPPRLLPQIVATAFRQSTRRS